MDKRKKSVDFSIKATWLAISKMYNAIGQGHDISHSTGFVLLNIDKENGTPATKIAPLLGMEARSLTRMLKSMEEKEYIVRIPDTVDRRKVIIKLTELGQIKREMARRIVKGYHKNITDNISEEELETFFKVIQVANQYTENVDWSKQIDLTDLNTDY